jgi:hypothetical protein
MWFVHTMKAWSGERLYSSQLGAQATNREICTEKDCFPLHVISAYSMRAGLLGATRSVGPIELYETIVDSSWRVARPRATD